MKRSKKWLLVLSTLLLMPPPIYLLWENSNFWQKYLKLSLPQIKKINPIFTWYLIIISTIVIIVLIFSFITLIFWPTQKSFNLIHKNSGQVKVTSKAINGYILSSLTDLPYLNNPKVNSRLTKHHIKIKISGDLGAGENVAALLKTYLEELKGNLKQTLGIEQKPKIKIKFNNFQEATKSEQRVQ
ncbi:alkaline shock response membrane anchor protein AmaP [Lactobacillus sp. ESL0785]|uniref:alkaline shock response membrane anchor protein AmaP n=1 Tax=Lactobacillus sp. ESL0785 TaxID=2983232 RepID=UPI0023F85ED0|nr:alkaline shock response membrane anchor protein AmaP [Lactobacillus sp. ESL0785]WEV70849.1 alkaline shock response membrane anchor protein AmaP [Lactobacillus sp. ESL0785]